MTNAALFVFAHQDDEIAAASRILYELRRGTDVYCAFLTDGGAIRNRESLSVLTTLGVAEERILFAAAGPDGSLVDHLDLALERLENAFKEIGAIYCLAWEGGHQDHDASQLVAAALAHKRAIPAYELPLYNGAGTIGPFFRVFSPIGSGWERRRLPFGEGLRIAGLAMRYRSQRTSWLGLLPEAFLKLAILRRESIRRIDVGRFHEKPHAGPLFYERRFKFPYERFARASARFVSDRLAIAPPR